MKLASCVSCGACEERRPHALRVSSIDVIGGESQIHAEKSPHLCRMHKECAKLWART
jgi:ferredoxin